MEEIVNDKNQARDLSPGCLLSRKEVAQILGVHPGSVKRYEKRGLLRPVKFNPRLIRYHRETVEEFISKYCSTTAA